MRVLFSLLSTVLNLTLVAFPALSQQQQKNPQESNGFRIRVETSGAWSLWDDSRNELIIGDSHPRGERPASLVNIYNALSGEKRSLDILKEFPDAEYVYIQGLANGPDGSVLVTCEVNSASNVFAGDRLLLYDGRSKLAANLLAADYDVGAAALDKKGNIYVAGLHENERSSKESYPLLVEYDVSGHIALEALPRSLFPDIDDPVGDGIGDPRRGATRVAVSEQVIHVYLAPASEMIMLNQAGKIQTRLNVASKLTEFAKTEGYKAIYVNWDEFSPSGDLWFVGVLTEPSVRASAMLPARNFVVRLKAEGQLQVPYKEVGEEPPGHYLPQLIGFTQSNEPVGSSHEEPGYLFVQKGPY
jgi:hypothetical protein